MKNSIRFEIFKRDNFICQYCGNHPPIVILEVDHILAISKGGKDDTENLITACRECNSGKSNKNLSAIPEKVKLNIEDIKEKKLQLQKFYIYQKEIAELKEKQIEEISNHWKKLCNNKFHLNELGKASMRKFLKFFTSEEIKDAIDTSIRITDVHHRFQYLCGILHNQRRKKGLMWGGDKI